MTDMITELCKIFAREIRDRQFPEYIVENGRGFCDAIITGDLASRLEPRKYKCVHKLIQRYAVLQPDRDRDGEIVHQAAERCAFLVHIDEDFAECAFVKLASVQINFVPADCGLLDIALAAIG